ncbi:MAG: hypothetical protein QXM68_03425 [Candidatus Aenigmatarchaeota archaeon]|nr:hypothetical protein [Candidatus Aenigmarchaeota archaeon]
MDKKEWETLNKKSEILAKIAEIFRVEEKDVPRVAKRFLDELNEMKNSNS